MSNEGVIDEADSLIAAVLEAEADARKALLAVKRLRREARAHHRRASELRSELAAWLEARNLASLQTPAGQATLALAGTEPLNIDGDALSEAVKLLRIDGPAWLLPLLKPVWQPDRRAIVGALKGGQIVPFARLGQRRLSVRIY